MAASLEDTARRIKRLPQTDPLQLQEGMYRPLQVHQDCTQVHCIMFMFERLLGAIRHLDIYASIWIMRLYYMHRYVLYMRLKSLTSLYFELIRSYRCMVCFMQECSICVVVIVMDLIPDLVNWISVHVTNDVNIW